MSGTGNPSWVGAERRGDYPAEYYKIRKSIIQRDGGSCAVPMCRTRDVRVHVHHIDYNKENNSPLNLITACPSCNARANFDRVPWKALLSNVLKWRVEHGDMSVAERGSIEVK